MDCVQGKSNNLALRYHVPHSGRVMYLVYKVSALLLDHNTKSGRLKEFFAHWNPILPWVEG